MKGRALRLMDTQETLKVRALPNGTLLLEAEIEPRHLAGGYFYFTLEAASETELRDLLNERTEP